jgi:hypothetical protein
VISSVIIFCEGTLSISMFLKGLRRHSTDCKKIEIIEKMFVSLH